MAKVIKLQGPRRAQQTPLARRIMHVLWALPVHGVRLLLHVLLNLVAYHTSSGAHQLIPPFFKGFAATDGCIDQTNQTNTSMNTARAVVV